ncbi:MULTISPECIES: arginine--tRNA ligase [unclassified Actinomyces]|uniref:arginine--tRNA ligase n=1 Tax=unclassified Actinomyces TaxID=2609248 RepID=UPI0020175A6C|nr:MULTISPECIES: arginine--tRNA ligase [unclassified Actinomyces]MCL3778426.1 arginine--tRNA ligase [Actinomyces sp. AC-20-1]MCL3790013.1 arginine--tRNA ligase [Actinomyces sp. 187325]MCL3792557.1 arginine--tRNA ligase [Actinomyces sp. 186855]MCL3794590.1 arginine--tRNA ligase [Actinomyces sp. 217892]
MTPEELADAIRTVLLAAAGDGTLNLPVEEVPLPKVERPRSREHGDWATNVAMQLAKRAGTSPRALAELLCPRLAALDGVASVEVAGPGFLNIRLDAASAGELARTIVEAGEAYGRNDSLAGQSVNLEYVSANPTGPVHLGGARWAAVGDSLARVLAACGARVTREYYFNDHGTQIDRFARSLLAAARGEDTPEDGYGGSYIAEIAATVTADELAAARPDPATLPDDEATEVFRSRGVDLMFDAVKAELHAFRSDFDVFFHEDSLHASGAVDRAIERLRERGMIVERDGATWLRTTDFGDDKDRVLTKSDGNAAYFAGDVAYYLDKRSRGADCAIYLLGADHHGYIGRMMAMCAAFGDEPGVNMQILIGQLVNLVKDGEPVRMSKRAGTIVTLEDLVAAVGVDAARYSLARASMDSMIDIDLDLLSSASNENPVYYVQYAHARTRNVARNAAEHGVSREAGFEPAALDTPADSALLGALARFPAVVAQAASMREQHRVARYLEELAGAYHTWYAATRVTPRGDDPVDAGHVARLWLNDAVSQVLANGLALLGVSAPERM